MRARLWPAVSRQEGNAAFAAETASSTSFGEATWTRSVMRESSWGLWIVRVSEEEDWRY